MMLSCHPLQNSCTSNIRIGDVSFPKRTMVRGKFTSARFCKSNSLQPLAGVNKNLTVIY